MVAEMPVAMRFEMISHFSGLKLPMEVSEPYRFYTSANSSGAALNFLSQMPRNLRK